MRGRNKDPKTPDVHTNIKLAAKHLRAGPLFVHVVKHYLFVRGLLPAPFETFREQVLEAHEAAQAGTSQTGDEPARKRSRGAKLGLKRCAKVVAALSAMFDALCSFQSDPACDPVHLLLILGPSVSRPREVVELVVQPRQPGDEQYYAPNSPSCAHSPSAGALSSDLRKAFAKLSRSLVGTTAALPLCERTGSTRLFVAMKGGCSDERFFERRPDFQCTLRNSLLTLLVVHSSPLSAEPESAAITVSAAAGDSERQQHLVQDAAMADPSEHEMWHVMRASIKRMQYSSMLWC